MSLSIDKIKPASKRVKNKKKSISEEYRPTYMGSVDTPHIRMKKQTPPTDESAQPRGAKEAKIKADEATKPRAAKNTKEDNSTKVDKKLELKAPEETRLKVNDEVRFRSAKDTKEKSSSRRTIKENLGKKNTTVTKLKGRQLELAKYFYKKIEENALSDTGEKSTERLGPRKVAEEISWDLFMVKNTINRLQKKGFLITTSRQIGNGGWSQYALSTELTQHIEKILVQSI